MKFCWSTLHVADMEQSLAFYQQIVGLKISRRFPYGPKGEIVFLGEGDTQVELIADGSAKKAELGPDISWGFAVPSLDDMLAKVQSAGIAVHSGPFQPNPHVKFFYVLDPDGMKIQFVENM